MGEIAPSPLARLPGALAAGGRATVKAGAWPGDHLSRGQRRTALRSKGEQMIFFTVGRVCRRAMPSVSLRSCS
jgi:hypothetical protein